MRNIKWLFLGMVMVVLSWSGLAGCKSTANGAGKDIEKMGEKIQEKTQ